MAKEISRVAQLAEEYRFRGLRRERKGYLNIFSVEVEGFPHRQEFMDRGSAVVVLPVDFRKEELYLIEQPRPNKAFAESPEAIEAMHQARGGEVAEPFTVPGVIVRTLDVPAGMIDPGETPAAAAVRELREETGFVLSEAELLVIGTYYTSVGGTTERHFAFMAPVNEETDSVAPPGDGGEQIVTYAMPWKEAFDLLRDRKITNASASILLRELQILHLKARLSDLE